MESKKDRNAIEGRAIGALGSLTFTIVSLWLSQGVAMPQSFRSMPGLSFSMEQSGASPLPQVIDITSTGANFRVSGVTATAAGGGSWLHVNVGSGCCENTPFPITVSIVPAAGMAAGSYAGSISMKQADLSGLLTIPVTLTIRPTNVASFDTLPGALTFSMLTQGDIPVSQALSIRTAGTGTLSWTASLNTSDGGGWLSVSAASGTGNSSVNISVTPAKLPGAGLVPGTFTGQVVMQTSGDKVTVPVTFTIGDSVFRQVNPLYFTKAFAGANPLPQVLSIASTGADFRFASVTAVSSTGGNWLSVNVGSGCCLLTPAPITVSAKPDVTLAAGTYTGEILISAADFNEPLVVPVSLTVEATSGAFFDTLPGQLTFSMAKAGTAPPSQVVQIKNAESGTLSWTASASTGDNGNWITLSATSGTAPSTLSVSVNPANVPGGGLVAGTFTGQVVLQTTGDKTTIPVTFTIGDNVFRQVNPLSFTKVVNGANPLPQVISVAGTGADFRFASVMAVSSTGGNWLSVNVGSGCCLLTPAPITVSAKPDVTLVAGTYTGEILISAADFNEPLVVAVSLTIQPSTAAFFDATPGQLSFSMLKSGTAPPSQPLLIKNAEAGTFSWTTALSTSDGGAWLTLSSSSGSSDAYVNVTVNPANVPGGGLVAGTFTGQVVLKTSSDRTTIPVTFTIGDNVFRQINPLVFNQVLNGADPLPQVISIASTGTDFRFASVTAVSSTGGNWLSVNVGSGCCLLTPAPITVSAKPDVTLAAGTYTGEILISAADFNEPMVVPVTLYVEASSSTFFDTLPGALTFSAIPGAASLPTRTVQIRNAGKGTLDWTLSALTADGGKWLSVSQSSGTALTNLTVTVNPANLPGKGLKSGTFTGAITLQNSLDRVTIPVVVTFGASVFKQGTPINFGKAFQGADPASQTLAVASTGTDFRVLGVTARSSTGGSWLSVNVGTGCCVNTPASITVSAKPDINLAAGVYTGEILLFAADFGEPSIIPVNLTVSGTALAATPVFTPPAGTYTSAQSVVITDATHGASIFYTTDGTTPTTSSKTYSGPISVTATQTLKAIAIAPGFPQSATATAVYTLTQPTTGTPTVAQTITISDATAGATVYYTTNGSTPTTLSTKYTGPITLSASSILKFIAVSPDHLQSSVRTVTTTIQ